MLNKFLKKSWNPILFRIISMIVFLFFMLVLYFASIKIIFNFNEGLVMFILWTLWWPFLYISLFLFGRAWCGFICPIGLTNELGNKFGNSKKDLFMKYSFIPFVLFFIIVFWEQVSGLFYLSNITFLFLETFFISAFLVGMFLPRWGFCRNFCPIGTLLGPFSRLSILGVRTRKEICEKCTTYECMRGAKKPACPMYNNVPGLDSNKNCLICLNCIKNCPYDSAHLSFVKPGEELKKKAGFNLSESLFIVSLLGFALLLTTKGTQFFRIFEFSGSILRAFDFIFALGFFILGYYLLTFIFSRIDDSNFKINLKVGGYVFLPLAFSLMFLSIVFGFIAPLINANTLMISISKYIILTIGILWGVKIARDLFKKNSFVHISGIILVGFLWFFILIAGPLNLINEKVEVYFAEDGEIINMDAFSMGFDPDIIEISFGSDFKINLVNIDIAHSFDLDEMNIHVKLETGDEKLVEIKNLEKGEYEYYCKIPGHREAGMKGILRVV